MTAAEIRTTTSAAVKVEDSLHWSAVEMAAVNQAILSLTGQQPIDVMIREALSLKNMNNDGTLNKGQTNHKLV